MRFYYHEFNEEVPERKFWTDGCGHCDRDSQRLQRSRKAFEILGAMLIKEYCIVGIEARVLWNDYMNDD